MSFYTVTLKVETLGSDERLLDAIQDNLEDFLNDAAEDLGFSIYMDEDSGEHVTVEETEVSA